MAQEWGAVQEAATLFRKATEAMPYSGTYALNYTHTLEVRPPGPQHHLRPTCCAATRCRSRRFHPMNRHDRRNVQLSTPRMVPAALSDAEQCCIVRPPRLMFCRDNHVQCDLNTGLLCQKSSERSATGLAIPSISNSRPQDQTLVTNNLMTQPYRLADHLFRESMTPSITGSTIIILASCREKACTLQLFSLALHSR